MLVSPGTLAAVEVYVWLSYFQFSSSPQSSAHPQSSDILSPFIDSSSHILTSCPFILTHTHILPQPLHPQELGFVGPVRFLTRS